MECNSVDQMQNPKSDERESNQQPVGARFSKLAPSAPQQPKSKDPGDIHQRVEDPIRQDLHPDVAECLLLQSAQKMMPLQNLVKKDAVKKSRPG